MMSDPVAEKLSILVVDDEALIVMLLEDMLLDLGCDVVGPASAVGPAITLIETGGQTIDGAILDVNLRGELIYPVADLLQSLGVPFVFVTGYASHGVDPRYAAVPALAKPFALTAITDVVKTFADRRHARIAV
jgi:CheY-like chemotaxis protein